MKKIEEHVHQWYFVYFLNKQAVFVCEVCGFVKRLDTWEKDMWKK